MFHLVLRVMVSSVFIFFGRILFLVNVYTFCYRISKKRMWADVRRMKKSSRTKNGVWVEILMLSEEEIKGNGN